MSNSSASRNLKKSKTKITNLGPMLLEQGTEDYAAARCCLLNHLFSGLPIAAQAVEKYLKAYIYFLDPAYSKNRKHDLIALAEDLKNLEPSFPLEKFRGFLGKLHSHYESRYPDSVKTYSASTTMVRPLDVLMLHLSESMPLSDFVKCTYGFYFWTEVATYNEPDWPIKEWLMKDNHALASKLPK